MRTTNRLLAKTEARKFIIHCCLINEAAWSTPAALYAAYERWMNAQGESEPMAKVRLGHALTDLGFNRAMARGGIIIRLGLCPLQPPTASEAGS